MFKARGVLQIPPTSYWPTSQWKDNLPSHKTSQCVYKDSKIHTFNFYITDFPCSLLYALFWKTTSTIALSALCKMLNRKLEAQRVNVLQRAENKSKDVEAGGQTGCLIKDQSTDLCNVKEGTKIGVSSSAADLFPDILSERGKRMSLCHSSIFKEKVFNLKLHKELQK